MRRNRQQGVALVITLILLSVITLTAITFLILSRREKGAVATSTGQTVAKLGADAGLARAQAEILAGIMAEDNAFNYGFKVTTNYYNPLGFQPGNNALTNVNYDYLDGGGTLSSSDQEENIANLFYNPRPPVYVFTNRAQKGNADFRFYFDLNRNGRFEPSGLQPVVGLNGTYLATNGVDTGVPFVPGQPPPVGNFLSNAVVGDPEWIGVLERPDEPHGPDNRFVARYATVVVPSGKTLDLNKIHNEASESDPNGLFFRRNMGVGTWEMNLASFLVDLNTNEWTAPDDTLGANPYVYDPIPDLVNGSAFEDARSLVRYRYDLSRNNLSSAGFLFGDAFRYDLIDGYGSGPFLTNSFVAAFDGDDSPRLNLGWPGDENPQQYFSPGDLFDIDKTAIGASRAEITAGLTFPGRLLNAGLRDSTYDRYTFYRLLSQLGTDGGTERGNKVNINYDNKVFRNARGVASATNFVNWFPRDFFTNAVDNLMREYHRGHFNRVFGPGFARANNLAINIPVVTNGVFVYTPSINRLLQLAANIHDASTNRPGYPPTVFRPLFERRLPDDLYIVDWEVVDSANAGARLAEPLKDPFDPTGAKGRRRIDRNDNVYGVPWIVGAKKGLPNFNELAVDNIFEVTRKLQIRKPSRTTPPNETNQMYLISINSAVGVEAWNSYRDVYPRPVTISVTNELDVYVFASNSPAGAFPRANPSYTAYRATFRNGFTVPSWTGRGLKSIPERQSFLAPIATNFMVITNSIFRADSGTLDTVLTPAFQGSLANKFPLPELHLAFTNRLQFVIRDRVSGDVLDYVHMRMGRKTNLTQVIADPPGRTGYRGMYVTNRVGGDDLNASVPPLGVVYQIEASLGQYGTPGNVWRNYGFGQAAGQTAVKAIDKFKSFMRGTRSAFPPYGYSSNLVMQVPFTPSKRIQQTMTWQANDPLVHYTDGDLALLSAGTGVQPLDLATEPVTLKNIGRLNERYQPWGGNPQSSTTGGTTGRRNYDSRFKDPLTRSSDDWQFPTNKFPNVGWLGRVHRGTPWQTVYLKARDIPKSRSRRGGAGREWREWTGNRNRIDAEKTFPQEDRRLFDLFTAAFNDNATAGQLSVNQDGLAAWSAVLGGVIALTNTTPDGSWENYSPTVVITNKPVVIPPAGVAGTNSPLGRIVAGINIDRLREPKKVYEKLGDVLKAEELTWDSPFLNRSRTQRRLGITDAMYERIPQQIMGLLRGEEQPRYVIYAYGQALKPAERSLVTSGSFFGMCTNYQITAESATRAVVRVEGAPGNPRVVLESFNVLPPD